MPLDAHTWPVGNASFTRTHWTLVLQASRPDAPQHREALSQLCERYWYPLYAYARRKGHAPEEARDLTQEFILRLLEKNYLSRVDRHKGKFRAFLLIALQRFMANEWASAHRQKRAGDQLLVSIDERDAEGRYLCEPAHDLTPDKLYERQWALALLEQARARLRAEQVAAGKQRLYEYLEPCLSGEPAGGSYAEVAAALGLREGALKVAAHRLRRRYGQMLRAQIAETVSDPAEVDEELRHLFAALR